MRLQSWNSRFGNKAFIFSLDALIAVIVAVSLLSASSSYISRSRSEPVSELQAIRIGSDVLALMDYSGALDNLDFERMDLELNRLLPINYHMRIEAECMEGGPVTAETTDTFPKDRFIGAGSRIFITNASNYCIADFSIWLK
ncbi:hypothetical protein KY358_05870 [Candidatus Woesearchaeota archaeon]|nr:hypothetical protein [Candidatus Woesearchaeota archaeon]